MTSLYHSHMALVKLRQTTIPTFLLDSGQCHHPALLPCLFLLPLETCKISAAELVKFFVSEKHKAKQYLKV